MKGVVPCLQEDFLGEEETFKLEDRISTDPTTSPEALVLRGRHLVCVLEQRTEWMDEWVGR